MYRSFGLSICLVMVSASACLAEKNAVIEPKLAKIGSPDFTESFDGELPKSMGGVKGEWKLVDGVLVAKELAADKHAAVMNLQKNNHNSVVRFSFKFDEDTHGLHFSLNYAKGHLFRVVVTPDALSLNLDGDKNDPAFKAMVMGKAKRPFERGQWYTMQVEMLGDRVVAQTDNGATVEASNPKLDTSKPNYRFVMRGNSLAIDDLQIWNLK